MTYKAYDIPKALIWEAWLHVRANQGAAGIDAETIERFETKLVANLCKLWNRMSSGSYFPLAVKAVPIPKKSGGVRILGVPTVADRVAQTAVKMWLETSPRRRPPWSPAPSPPQRRPWWHRSRRWSGRRAPAMPGRGGSGRAMWGSNGSGKASYRTH
jgi:hypothetical protein